MTSDDRHWLRDLLVVVLALYMVGAFLDADWDSAPEPAPHGAPTAPVLVAPDAGAQHHNTTVRFAWEAMAVKYTVEIRNASGGLAASAAGLIVTSYASPGLEPGNYSYTVAFESRGNLKHPFTNGTLNLAAAGALRVDWQPVTVSYDFRLYQQWRGPAVVERDGYDYTEIEIGNLEAGSTYTWEVRARFGGAPDGDITGEWSPLFNVDVGTTRHLAQTLFEAWELPLVLLGLILMVALLAGVFLAQEESE